MKPSKKTLLVYMGLVAILAMAITVQLRTMAGKDSNASQILRNDELKDSLLQWEEKYNSMAENLNQSNKQLEKMRTSASTYDTNSQAKSEELKNNNTLIGLSKVAGEGVVITAKDGQATKATDSLSDYLVHDADLRGIVSELCNAGAEAISINNQRIVNSTCIVCAGNVISINGEKVTSPFIIKAIGNQERLYGINRPGGYLSIMKDYTSVEIKKSNNVEIEKFNGALNYKYAKTIN
ncbi:MAG: DUF881 domain-containing protein [Clostridia bacterium]|nr:DUF881 domain-containing protein [Clostridia bacterium]